MNKPLPPRVTAWAVQSTEWLVLLVLFAGCITPVLLRHHAATTAPVFNLLDWSWTLDTAYKASIGVWFGRDVLFTYGPLYQWLASAPSRWIGVSTGTIDATSNVVPSLVSVLAIFAGLRLLLPNVSPWRRAVFLAVVFWSPPGIRLAICLFAFVTFVRLTDVIALRQGGIVLSALVAGIICLAAFLISADAGIYCSAALLLCVAATAIVKSRTPGAVIRLCTFLAAAWLCVTIFVVATNAVMGSALNFSYWKSSLVLAAGYRWFEPKAITEASTWRMLGTLALAVGVFGVAWWKREPEGDHWTLRPTFLLAGFCLAVLMMQSALVRSDPIHVVNGIYPMVFFSGAILIGELTSARWVSALLVVGFVVTAPFILTPSVEPPPSSALKGARELLQPNLACPEGKQEFDHACFGPTVARLFSTTSNYIDQHTSPGDAIVVFPYQNAFGVMARRNVAGGVLQGYLVNGEYLTELDLAGLRKANPPVRTLLSGRGDLQLRLDGVPSFTRSPGIWFYLLRHYRSESSPDPGVVGLVRDDSRDQRLSFTEEKLADALETVQVTKRVTSLDLGPIHWPAAGADFLKFRFRVNYGLWWKIRKPSALTLLISFADRLVEVDPLCRRTKSLFRSLDLSLGRETNGRLLL